MSLHGGIDYESLQAAVHGGTGAELPFPFHTDNITVEQRELLRGSFDFVIVGGTHANPAGKGRISAPTDIEYDAAADAIRGLDAARGDMLFIEGPMRDGASVVTPEMGNTPNKLRRFAHTQRDEGKIDAFLYAGVLATSEGIATKHADIGRDMAVAFLKGIGRSDPNYLKSMHSVYDPRPMRLRNEQAAYSVKDSLLLKVQQEREDASRKVMPRRIAMLIFGGSHVVDEKPSAPLLPVVYNQMGLEAEVRILPDSQEQRREAMELPPPPDTTGMDPAEAVTANLQYFAKWIIKMMEF